MKMQNKG